MIRCARGASTGRHLDDLHDEVIQTLFGVGLTLQAAAVTSGEEGLADRLEVAAQNLAGAVRDLREYAKTNDDGGPDDGDLENAIRRHAQQLAEERGVGFQVYMDTAATAAVGHRGPDLVQILAALLADLAPDQNGGSVSIRLLLGRCWVRLEIARETADRGSAPTWSRSQCLRLRSEAAHLACRLSFSQGAGGADRAVVWVPIRSAR